MSIKFNQAIEVNIDELYYDARLQRERTDMKHVRKIANEFDVDQYDPIRVVKRTHGSRKLAIVDGKHRTEALKLLGCSTIQAIVVTGRSYKAEGKLFRDSNTNSRPMSSLDLFRVEANSDPESDAASISAILKEYGVTVGAPAGGKVTASPVALRKAYASLGADTFSVMARVLAEGVPPWYILSAPLIGGLHKTFHYNDNVDDERLVEVLFDNFAAVSEQYRAESAYGGGGSAIMFANIIIDTYNEGLDSADRLAYIA